MEIIFSLLILLFTGVNEIEYFLMLNAIILIGLLWLQCPLIPQFRENSFIVIN
jgi:hypothetical protein